MAHVQAAAGVRMQTVCAISSVFLDHHNSSFSFLSSQVPPQNPQRARRQQRAADAVQAPPRSAQRPRNAAARRVRRGPEPLGQSTVEAHPEERLQGELLLADGGGGRRQCERNAAGAAGRDGQQDLAEVSVVDGFGFVLFSFCIRAFEVRRVR